MNQKRVDAWLESQGIQLPRASASDPGSLTLEELVREKEKLEDLIAEREYAIAQKAEAKAAEPESPRRAPASA